MVLLPPDRLIPLIRPVVAVVELVVALFRLAMVLSEMVTAPVPALLIPYTDWAFAVEAELALMLLAVAVLPMVLLLRMVVPAEAVLLIP